MKTITIMDEALEHLEVLDLLTPCNNCATYYEPDDRDAPRQLCPECQPVALEAPALTREWLEHNIRLALPGLSTARVGRLTDHLYGNLAMMQQAQAQGVEPLDETPGKSKLTLEHLDRLPRVEAESAVFTLNKPVVQRLARSLGIKPEPPPEDRPQTVICQLCGDSITAEQWRYDRCPSPDAAPRPKDEYVEAEVHTRHSHAITETQAALLGLKKEE